MRPQKKLVLEGQPQLETGINLIEKPGKLPVFQSLLAKEIEGQKASAIWVDTHNEASTYALQSFGGPNILDKVYIGRAFTPFQHHRTVENLDEFLLENTEFLVLPQISSLYEEGQIKEWEARELFQETWQRIKHLQREHNLKVLVSVSHESELGYAVQSDADNRIQVEETGQGWRYKADNYQQMIYRQEGWLQTTVPYWVKKRKQVVELKEEV